MTYCASAECRSLTSSAVPTLTVHLLFFAKTDHLLLSGKQRNIAKYYKNQENLLKDFSRMETMNEWGCRDPSAPSEVVQFYLRSFTVISDFVSRRPIYFFTVYNADVAPCFLLRKS
jgi:hypothetical protein